MEPKVRLRNGVYRVVESTSNKLCRTKKGTVMDGGGHKDKETALRQAKYIGQEPKLAR